MKRLTYEIDELEFSVRIQIVIGRTYKAYKTKPMGLHTIQTEVFDGIVNFIYENIKNWS